MPSFFNRGRRDPQRRDPTQEQQQQQQQHMPHEHPHPTLDQPITLPSLPAITPHEPLSMLNSPLSPPSSHAEGVTRGFERLNFIGSDRRPDSSNASIDDSMMAIDSENTTTPHMHTLSRSLSHSQHGVKAATTPPRPHGPQRSRSVSGTRERTRVIYRIGSRKRLKSTSGSEDEGDDSYSVPATPITGQQGQHRSSSGNRVHSRTTSHPVFSSTPNFASFSGNGGTPVLPSNSNGTPMFGSSSTNSMAISNLLSSTPSKNHHGNNPAGSVAASSDESDDDSVDHELEDKLLKFYRTEIHDAVTHDRYADAEKYIIAYLKRTNFIPLPVGPASQNPSTSSSPSSTSPSRASQHTTHSSITSPTTSSPGRTPVGRGRHDDERTQTMMLYNLSYAQSAQQKWHDSLNTLKLLHPKAFPDLEHFILDLTAVTLMNLNQLDDAKSACSKALKKRRKATDPKVSSLANDSCYLMSRILDKYEGDADAEVESKFYRSLLPADYNPPSTKGQQGGQGHHMVVRRRISGEALKSNGGLEKGLVRKSSRAALQADGGIMKPVKEEPVEDGNTTMATVTLPSNA